MKKFNQLALAVLVTFVFFSASAQVYLGGQFGYNRYLGGTGIGFLGIGVNGEKAIEDNSVRISLNYGLPYKQDASFPLNYKATDFYAKDVNGTVKYAFITLAADFKFYLGDGDNEVGGIYLLGGAGVSVATVGYNLDTFDENLYYTSADYSQKERFIQPIIRLGAGYELELDFANLFFDASANIPATSVNGAAVSVNLPFSFGAQAGIKFPISK